MCCLKLLEHLYYCAEISLSAAIVLANLILFINCIEICSFITIQFNNLAKNNLITKTYLYCYCRVHTQPPSITTTTSHTICNCTCKERKPGTEDEVHEGINLAGNLACFIILILLAWIVYKVSNVIN